MERTEWNVPNGKECGAQPCPWDILLVNARDITSFRKMADINYIWANRVCLTSLAALHLTSFMPASSFYDNLYEILECLRSTHDKSETIMTGY